MKMIDLRGMDRDGLHHLTFMAEQVKRAMMELEQIGGLVTVSMVPGAPILIECENPIFGQFSLEEPSAIVLDPAPIQVVFPAGIEPETPETRAAPAVSPGDEARAPSDGEQASAVAGEDTEPGTPSDDAAPEGAEPVVPGSAVGNAAGHPPAAEDEAHGGRPPRWTDAENATALKIVVDAVLAGGAASSAGQAVAEATGRPVAGVQFRIKTVWRDEIAAAVAKAREAQLASVPDDDLTRHLRSVPRKGWPIKDDLDLVKFAFDGWGVSEMRLELKRDEKSIKERRRVLTSDNRFKLKDVLARLKEIEAEAA